MKKITLKSILFLAVAFITFQIEAQLPGGATGGTFKLRTWQVATNDYRDDADNAFVGEFLYPTIANRNPITSGKEALALTPLDDTNNDQTFEFVNTNRIYTRTVTLPDGSQEERQHFIYYIQSVVTGKGVLELDALDNNSQRIRLRGQDGATAGQGAEFWVAEVTGATDPDSGDPIPTYHRIESTVVRDGISPNRRFHQDTRMEWLNYLGSSGNALDRWLIEPATVLSTPTFKENTVSIVNPISNDLVIKSADAKINNVKIFNILGVEVLQKSFNGVNSLNLNTSSLSSGLYIVKLIGDNTEFSKKIIKE